MQQIKIDFDNPGLPQRLDVVENDAQSRFFKAVLYKDGKAYTAPSGATYSIMYRGFGPQNEGWYDTINDGAGKRAACSVSGNIVTCEIARQALRVPGHVSVMLCVTESNGYMLHGWPIDCNCRNDSYTGGTSVESFFYITQVTNADWTSAIKTWEELKNMIDPTLSVEGKAADAKAVGTIFDDVKNDLNETDKALNDSLTPGVKKISVNRIYNAPTINLKSDDIWFSDYRGYGYLCYIPRYFCGVKLNLKIKKPNTLSSEEDVTVTITIKDKENPVNKSYYSKSDVFNVKFSDGYGYINNRNLMFDCKLFNIPEKAFVFIEVSKPYKLAVLVSGGQSFFFNLSTLVYDKNYTTRYIATNDDIIDSGENSYYCDFGLCYTAITTDSVSEISDKIDSLEKSFEKNYHLTYGYNNKFTLSTETYSFVEYRGYGWLINVPKVLGGIWLNALVKAKKKYTSDFTDEIEITVQLLDKETKEKLYEYSSKITVDFTATNGIGKIESQDVLTANPIVNLPSQCYLLIILPEDYYLAVTTNPENSKLTSIYGLDEKYRNLYVSRGTYAEYITAQGTLGTFTCDIGVYDITYTSSEINELKKLYFLHDAYMRWCDGEKFPVAFAGDSTTDGYRTTNFVGNVLGTDHTTGYLYTDVLQSLLREETKNNTLRIYNAGFSGMTMAWMLGNFENEFGEGTAYADTKMIGISFGINDRISTYRQYQDFKNNTILLCKKCIEHGIQPFLLTAQAGAENSAHLNRYESTLISYANKAKKEIARELDLEIIDISKFTANFLNYSNKPIQTILYDYCHFNDYGHSYEGGLIFKKFVPRVIAITEESKIGFETQGIKSDLEWGDTYNEVALDVQMLPSIYNGFKTKAVKTSRTDNSDIVVMDMWVFIDGKKPLTLKTYTDNPYTLRCVIDNDSISITTQEQTIRELDLGLHHVVIQSGTSTNIDFYGCKFV